MSKVKDFLLGMKEGFSSFGFGVTGVVNFVLLSFVYVFGVGLTSVAAKATGKRFLGEGVDSKKVSYYGKLGLKKKDVEDYYRQF